MSVRTRPEDDSSRPAIGPRRQVSLQGPAFGSHLEAKARGKALGRGERALRPGITGGPDYAWRGGVQSAPSTPVRQPSPAGIICGSRRPDNAAARGRSRWTRRPYRLALRPGHSHAAVLKGPAARTPPSPPASGRAAGQRGRMSQGTVIKPAHTAFPEAAKRLSWTHPPILSAA